MIKAVIFDFDGTLVDSEPNYALSDVIVVNKFGGNISLEDHHKYIGTGAASFIKAIKEEYPITASDQEILDSLSEEYLKLALKNTPVFPEMKRLVQTLHHQGIPMAVASGTPTHLLNILLDHTGLAPYFSVILSSDEVEQGKPEPDVFLEAARRLGQNPENCLVMEDSPPGAHAAMAAGMDLITIPGDYLKDHTHLFPKEGIFLSEGMDSFRAEMVLEKFKSHSQA